MDTDDLTDDEARAIRSLERLASRWPSSLLIFASGGRSLSVRKPRADGGYGVSTEVADVHGIPNDGGDGSDEF